MGARESYLVLNLCSTRTYYHSPHVLSREIRTNFLYLFMELLGQPGWLYEYEDDGEY